MFAIAYVLLALAGVLALIGWWLAKRTAADVMRDFDRYDEPGP